MNHCVIKMARISSVKKPYEVRVVSTGILLRNTNVNFQRSGARASDKVWKHDRAPGIPAAVKATNATPATSNAKLVVSNLHYEVTARDLIVSLVASH